jgi:hypothetical protein
VSFDPGEKAPEARRIITTSPELYRLGRRRCTQAVDTDAWLFGLMNGDTSLCGVPSDIQAPGRGRDATRPTLCLCIVWRRGKCLSNVNNLNTGDRTEGNGLFLWFLL